MATKKELPPDAPKKGERWESLHGGGVCRVMCDPVEGYVMARYKGAGPWLLHVNDWLKKFKRQNT
ncbi:MAG: hypothetical protein H5U32_03210 [Pseudomonas balearica]|uniref:hypothetical protein n=1 Tax=Stutzerimonas balearica TaxID=74829 RepID=UPI0019B8BA18|nr:hypothetical protein [Stutzerimonas balearica]MBC7198237.1 hypothetical protein [Stutzerimonas balearica]